VYKRQIPEELVDATALIGTESEVAERLERFNGSDVHRLIVTPVQLDREQRLHTIERLAALVGTGAQEGVA
jgi:alkanesulfonate monooxygenase SsuD/methylene tetrahydromethanopterin reductase-like flavin-dependent oxidoreductase (luciferase family)